MFLARWGWSKVPLEKLLLLGFTQQTSRNSLDFDYLSLFIPMRTPVEKKQDKNSLNATFLTAPFLPWAAPAVSHL